MRNLEFDAMPIEELWLIHEELTKVLAEKIISEKRELEKRLEKLNQAKTKGGPGKITLASNTDRAPRRKYPKVLAKYCNPQAPLETWSGRGKQPRWLVAALKAGHKLHEFKIRNVENETDK
jgi:DNA-binding protein H-NS